MTAATPAKRPPRKPSTPKPFEVTPAVCKKVKRLAGLGLTLPEIGGSLGLSTTTLKHWRRTSPELAGTHLAFGPGV